MIVDYGVGNLFSIKCAMEKVGFNVVIGSSKTENADALILPGVGDFSTASRNLEPLKETIINMAKNGTPIIGICLGAQLLLEKSEEGEGKGLALIEGKNVKLLSSVKVPHMGWNTVHLRNQNMLTEGLKNGSYFYFAHSYYPNPKEKEVICAETTYGVAFASIIAKEPVYGTQFHPEKSGKNGMILLENFLRLVKK